MGAWITMVVSRTGIGFGQGFDALEDAQVNAMDDGIRPHAPVLRRPQAVLVPACAFEQGAVAGQGSEAEFPLAGDKVAVKVLGLDIAPGAPFVHGRGTLEDAEAEEPAGLPGVDLLDHAAGGEIAGARGANS